MTVALFVIIDADPPETDAVAAGLGALPDLEGALFHRSVTAMPDYPFVADGSGPALVLELAFGSLDGVEAALRPDRLGRLGLPASAKHQVFAAREFAVDDPVLRTGEPCTFLVQYDGRSDDPQAWLDHYDTHHPPIMRRFPGIRQVATYRPLAWRSDLPWARADALQRNKVVFDDPAALAAALASPVMGEMRADRNAFPPFAGTSAHYPMHTRRAVMP